MSNAAVASSSSVPSSVGGKTIFKIVATVLAIGGAVTALLTFSMDDGAAYYMHVDEALARNDLDGKRLKVHGFVVKDSIEQKPGTLQYRFKIQTRPPRAPGQMVAFYTGIVPDTFKSESEVVAMGYLNGNNELKLEGQDAIMAKCPSKYEAKGEAQKMVEGGEAPSKAGTPAEGAALPAAAPAGY